jgi:ATP-binding cassette subfamily B protein
MKKNSTKSFRQLISYAKPWRFKIVIASIYSIVNKLFDIMPEILIGFAVDLVVKRQDSFIASLGFNSVESQISILAFCTFLIWAFESLFQYLYSVAWRNLAQSIEHEIRIDAYSHVQNLNIKWFEDQKTGNITSILNDDINQLERFLDNGANDIIQIIVSTLTIGAVFFFISPTIAAIAVIPVPVILFVASFFQKSLEPRYLNVRNAAGNLSSTIFNNLLGIMTIKSFTSESLEKKRVSDLSESYQVANRDAIRISSAFVPVVRMGVLSGFLGTMVLGGLMAFSGAIAVGSFSVLLFLTQRFLWPFTRLGEIIDLFARSMASTRRIMDLIDAPIEIKDDKDSISLENLKDDIVFNDVSFEYSKDSKVFKDLSFRIKSNSLVGIVGKTGVGKSTLIKLLLRLYNIDSGQIKIGNHNINGISLKSLRKNIGLVSQETFLFDGTIYDNISYPILDTHIDKIKRAAELSQCDEFIDRFPDGYNTVIGERGQRLSVGQKQRISIARAILKDPSILIFDEATSSVDNRTENLIQKSLKEISKDRTTIAIAHRLSTIRNADLILVLDDGKIIESGTHDELVELNGNYKYLWDLQTGQLNF